VSSDRDEAVQNFLESTDIDRKVLEAVAKVLSRSPRAVLIAWETDESFGITAIPFSTSLIKGMVDTAFDAVFGEQGEEHGEDPN
jgi:hypothetical protein